MNNSKLFNVNWKDFLKGLVLAIGTPLIYLVQEMIPNWPLNPIEKAALSALVAYLIKNFFTNNEGQIAKKDG